MVYVILEKILCIAGIVLVKELQGVEMEYAMMVKMNLRAEKIVHLEVIMNLLEICVEMANAIVVKNFLALMIAICTLQRLIVEMANVIEVKKHHVLTTALYNLQRLIVEMVNAIVVRNQHALMIAPLNVLKGKFQMGKAGANMIVVD
jgi:hypothetical protein